MAQYSYNGWLASARPSDFGGLQQLIVAGESFAPGVRAGDVHTILEYVAEQLNHRVEPVVKPEWHQADDWGYSFRPNVNNPSQLSCHASGTAFDYNATRHPNGKRGTWTSAQVGEVRKILAEVEGTVAWGEDFRGTIDGMHFEIQGTSPRIAAIAQKIRALNVVTPVPSAGERSLEFGMRNDEGVRKAQTFFRAKFPLYAGDLPSTGNYLGQTVEVVKEFQKRAGVTGPDANGRIIGSRTFAAMRRFGWR
jgi:peptidoglycan hydrolase-like protein with peptidoglycan-binding domain